MQIKLANWMCYARDEISLDPHTVTILEGPTGSGKSAVLDAIEWAILGTARGFTKLKDKDNFRGDPSKPTAVELKFDDSGGWATTILRGSKFKAEPESFRAEWFKENQALLSAALRPWDVLDMSERDRGAVIGSLGGGELDEAKIIGLIANETKCASPGDYNGLAWGRFATVSEAHKQAVAIRASYQKAKTAKVPEEDIEEAERIRGRLAEIGDNPRPDSSVLDDLKALAEEKAGLEREIAGLSAVGQSLAGFIDHMGGKRRCTCGEFDLDKIIQKVAGEPELAVRSRIKSVDERTAELAEAGEKATLALQEWRRLSGERTDESAILARIERSEKAITENAKTAEARAESWDKIAKATEPGGPVQGAIGSEIVSKLDQERIAWASASLAMPVRLTGTGELLCANRNPRQPSRGQRLIGSLIVRDAIAQAIGLPILLVDELETIDERLASQVVDFLAEVAEDYEAVIACTTRRSPDSVDARVNILRANQGSISVPKAVHG